MRFFSVFMLEIKRIFSLFFLIAISILVAVSLAQLHSPSFNIIGVIACSSDGVEIVGYGFNFDGQGVPLTLNISINGIQKTVVSNNGTFSTFIPILFPNGSNITIHIHSNNETYVISKILSNNFTTFAETSIDYSKIEYNNISMVYVKGITVIAASPSIKYIYVNGEKMNVNSNILTVGSDNVKPPFGKMDNLKDSQIIGKNIYYILSIIGTNMGLVSIIAYFYLSVFPRRQLDLIFRVAGVSKIYLSKLFSMLILTLLISLPSIAIFAEIKGIFLSSITPYLFIMIMYSLAVYGISPLMKSKELIYTTVIIAAYLLNLVFYNAEILSTVALILPLIGFIKLWWGHK